MAKNIKLSEDEVALMKVHAKIADKQEAEAEKEGMSIMRARIFAPVRKGKRQAGHLHGAQRQNRAPFGGRSL